MKKLIAAALVAGTLALTGCSSEADTVKYNNGQAADNFEIQRRIVFYNSITDTVMLEIIGRCAFGNEDTETQRTVTCKVAEGQYKTHFLGLSDNVTYYAEQLEAADLDPFYYRMNFRPQSIVPDIDLQTTDQLPPTQP